MTTQFDLRQDPRLNFPPRPVDVGPVDGVMEYGPLSVVSCSLCLKVLRAGVWIEAEEAIRELRSFERPAPLPLEPGLCDECSDHVRARRGRT